jgi:hypothetical protein
MWQFYFSKLPIILDILKILSNSKIIAIFIITVGAAIIFKPEIIKKYIMINIIQKQEVANTFYNAIDNILDSKLINLQKHLESVPESICIAEYIRFERNPEYAHTLNYRGQVMRVREYKRDLNKVAEVREERLAKTQRWLDYGTYFSQNEIGKDLQQFPKGSVKNIPQELLGRDDPYTQIMQATFRGPTGTGNFNFLVEGIAYDWLVDTKTNEIMGHVIFLCNKAAYDAIGVYNLQTTITQTHNEFVEMLNNLNDVSKDQIK